MSPLRLAHRIAPLFIAFAAVAVSRDARAFATRTTPGGATVRWQAAHVDFVASPSLRAVTDDPTGVVGAALAAWSGVDGAPALRVSSGDGSEQVAVDGRNVITYMPDGYPKARGALAVTILSYDAATGAIVDADIVINGNHDLEVLPDSARAASGAALFPTDSSETTDDSDHHGGAAFDLVHVLVHETGHALGLKDDARVKDAIMYPATRPGDASARTPTSDDTAGIASIYSGDATASAASGSRGCSTVGGAPAGGASLALAAMAVPVIFGRRARRRRVRA